MKNPQINQRIIYTIFALVGIGFLTALYFSIYRAPQEGIIISEISGVIESTKDQKVTIKTTASTRDIVVDSDTRVRAYNFAGTYEAASIENLAPGLSIVAGDIAGDRAGYIDIYLPSEERGGVIESLAGNTLTINSETHGKFSVTIGDNITQILTIDENGSFIPADRTHLSAGKVVILSTENLLNNVATKIEVYPSEFFNLQRGANEN